MTQPVWTRESALELIAALEPLAASCGLHIGLCGSVLHKGQSSDDLDLVLFPLKTRNTKSTDLKKFQDLVLTQGITNWTDRTPYHSNDRKVVFTSRINDPSGSYRRVDWFLFHIL